MPFVFVTTWCVVICFLFPPLSVCDIGGRNDQATDMCPVLCCSGRTNLIIYATHSLFSVFLVTVVHLQVRRSSGSLYFREDPHNHRDQSNQRYWMSNVWSGHVVCWDIWVPRQRIRSNFIIYNIILFSNSILLWITQLYIYISTFTLDYFIERTHLT